MKVVKIGDQPGPPGDQPGHIRAQFSSGMDVSQLVSGLNMLLGLET